MTFGILRNSGTVSGEPIYHYRNGGSGSYFLGKDLENNDQKELVIQQCYLGKNTKSNIT